MEPTKIFFIDDHKLFLEGLIFLLNEKPHLEVLGSANSASEFYKKADRTLADIYVVDVHLPGESGIEVTRFIREREPGAKILALSMHEDSHYIKKMIQNGANGYMFKSASLNELAKAISEVARGKTYFGQEVQKVVFEELGVMDELNGEGQSNKLSKREIEILSLIAKDFTTQQIADKLFISVRTVDTHRKNILTKTNTKSIVGMIKYAIREGLVHY